MAEVQKGVANMKKIVAILFVVVSFSVFADTWKDPNTGIEWVYTISNGEASVSDGIDPKTIKGAITIPSVLGGYPVTSIGDDAFYKCSALTSVTIPPSVTNIGRYAFAYCNSLVLATLPEGVTSIGNSAFYACDGLISVTIPSSVTNIGKEAFNFCRWLTLVTMPSSVTSIGYHAFSNCRLIRLYVSSGDTERVRNLMEAADISTRGVEFVDQPKGDFEIFDGVLIWYGGFGGAVTIPSSVKSIDWYAFEYCSTLTSVTMIEGVTSIGDRAFEHCSSLISVTIPSSMTNIGSLAFYDCTELKTVYVSLGDAERVKGLMTDKGVDVSKLTFVEKSEVIADVAALKEAFGAESSVVRNLTSEEELVKFNEFLGKCGITAASQISDKQKEYAYESFRMSAITVEPRLFENEPKLKIHEFKQGEGGWSVSISLKAGGEEIAMAKRALEEHISVGNKLTEITSKPDIVASPSEDGSSLTFTIAPPEGKQAFIMVRL